MIPVPPSQMPHWEEYIRAMGEVPVVTKYGSVYRLDGNWIARSAFSPVTEEKEEDLLDAYTKLNLAGVREILLTEHPMNRLSFDDFRLLNNITLGYWNKATYLINLNDEWRPNKKVKQNYRNFLKAGGEVRELSSDEVGDYWRLYLEHRKELSLPPWPEGCFRTIAKWIPDRAYVVGAFLDNELVAALSFLIGDGWVDEAHVARKNIARVYPLEAVRYEGIEKAKEIGASVYNLGGVEPNPAPGSKEEAIKRNKAKFNGEYIEYRRYLIK